MQEQLAQAINRYAKLTVEASQVSRRLKSLLPARLKQIKHELQVRFPGEKSTRQALADPRFTQFIDELIDTAASAREARIQHETHRMLYDARVSLREFRSLSKMKKPT